MKKYIPMKAWLVFLWLCFTLAQASAQTEIITFPVNGTVFQKDNAGNYNCYLAGQLQNTNAMYYRIQKKNGTSWNDIATDIQLSSTWTVGDRRGFYKAHGNLSTGWYRVRLYRKYKVWLFFNKRVYKDTKEFGVGDVYFIGGQSNAAGYSEEDPLSSGVGGDNTNPFYPVNISNEVRVIHNKNENSYSSELKNGIPYKSKFDPLVSGTHFLNDKKGFYPNGAASWCWPALGKMISDGGTPVMFFNNAWPGSSVNSDWNDNATLKGKFTRTLTQYGNILGAKGVLWHQGEEDANALTRSSNNSGANRINYLNAYKNGMNNLINESRSAVKDETTKNLSWYISRVGFTTGQNADFGDGIGPYRVKNTAPQSAFQYTSTSSASRLREVSNNNNFSDLNDLTDAQRQLQSPSNRIFPGVFSDEIGIDLNSDGLVDSDGKRASNWRIHFSGNSLNDLATEWKAAIDNNNPSNSVSPTNLVKLESVTGGGSSYSLSVTNQGSGSTYYWAKNDDGIYNSSTTANTNNSFSFNGVVGGDILTCYIMKPDGRLAASQPFIVPGGSYDLQVLDATNSALIFNSNIETKETIVLSQNVDWDVVSIPSWVTLNVDDENSKLSITTQQNPNSTLRQGNVFLQQIGGGISKTISLEQLAPSLADIPITSATLVSASIGYSSIRYNGLNIAGNTMTVSGQPYYQGIGTHAPSNIVYNIPSGYSYFKGLVGRDDAEDNCCGPKTLDFSVKLNGSVVWNSIVHGTTTDAQAFSIPLNGASQVELIVGINDGNNWGDWADWINPVLSTTAGTTSGSPAPPNTISANPSTVSANAASQLSATCAQGTVTWSTGATGSPITVNSNTTTTYNVNCVVGSAYSGSESITVNVSGGGGSCSAVTNLAVMGTWNVTGSQLVSRFLNGSNWLVQKVNVNGGQYDEFVVRGSEMLTRGDVTLNNSSYSGLVSCYSWQYSAYGGLLGPNATSSPAFPTPTGFHAYTAGDGTPYYSNYVAPSNSCSTLSNNLVMGTWNVTGHQLVSRNFHSNYWLVQKVNVNGSQYDEFVMRGSAMLTRTDVTLNNSAYYNLDGCYAWRYSNYGNLEGPPSSTFPTPGGFYFFTASDGTPYYTNYSNGYNNGARLGSLPENVEEELTPFLSFTPNPNEGEFEVIIFLKEDTKINVTLSNGVGRQVITKELKGVRGFNKLNLELNSKTPGLYILKAVSGENSDSKKVIVN